MKRIYISLALLCGSLIFAQQYMFPPPPGAFGAYGVDWTTARGDAQRSSWIRNDRLINVNSVAGSKPAFGLVFKLKLDDAPRQMDAFSEAILVGQARGGKGFKSLGYLTSAAGNAFAFDYDTGELFWKRPLTETQSPSSSIDANCSAFGTGVTRPTTLVFSEPATGGVLPSVGPLAQLPSSFHEGSAVGEPDQGAPNLPYAGTYSVIGGAGRGGAGAPGRGPAGNAAPGAPAGAGVEGGNPAAGRANTPPATPPPVGFGRGGVNGVYGISTDGRIHLMSFQQGFDVQMQPVDFVPQHARIAGFIVIDNVAYAATVNACGGVPDGLWSVSLASDDKEKKVAHWSSGAPIAGTAGFAIGTDQTVYVATGEGTASSGGQLDSVVALDPRSMQVKDYFTNANHAFNSSPVVFSYGNTELIAASNSDGKIYLFDRTSLKTPLSISPKYTDFDTDYSPGSLAVFRDTDGTNWILAPAKTGIVAFKLIDQNGKPAFVSGWTSPAMISPLTPVVVNGVVFALSSGEFHAKGTIPVSQRVSRSSPAVLYALNGTTGKQIWNSGKAITSFVPQSSGVSASVGQVYVTAYDGTLYTFSLLSERQ